MTLSKSNQRIEDLDRQLKKRRNVKLQQRRALLKDRGIPPMVAKQAAYWSNKRIKDELGVEIDELPY